MNRQRAHLKKALTQLLAVASATVWLPAIAFSATPEIDASKLPPAATNNIDFARDIKPIFDASCIRCHGPVKPKSGFRLDSRAGALKGGDNGIDIVPGNSAKSPLIHFTAQLVEDMEMPPPDKGEPLTAAQIGLLRAWIDQGASWNASALTNFYSASISPIFGGTAVHGDNQKFRELNWQKDGNYAGFDEFQVFRQSSSDSALLVNGHVVQNDYKLSLSLERTDIGFIRSGWEQYRKYYDNTGGLQPGTRATNALSLDQDLYLDVGKAWVDLGLTLPNWPRMVFGYEYDYRTGDEATTVGTGNGSSGTSRNVNPASKSIQEGTHVIKFDLDAEVQGVTIEDRFRGEFYDLKTHYTNSAARGPVVQNVKEKDNYFQGANSIILQKQFNDWFYGSGGYFYSHLDADASFTNVTRILNRTFLGSVPDISLERESHVANLNGLLGPWEGFTFSAGAQAEWTRQHGFGAGNLNEIAFTRLAPTTLTIVPTTLRANYDENSAMENMALRYTKIPFTVLFAEGRLEQKTIGQTDVDLQPTGNFMEKIDFSSELTDFRAGFTTSPWRWMSLTAHYRRYENDSHYPPNAPPEPAGGYPDFFRSRQLLTDEIETKLVVRPWNWLKTTFSYQYLTTDFRDNANAASNTASGVIYSPAGSLVTGRTDSQRYTFGAVFIPHPRVYFLGSFTYEPTRTHTANSDIAAIGHYRGDTYSADASGTYILSQTTDFSVGWVFSEANYGQANRTAAPPIDMRYQEHSIDAAVTRRLSDNVSMRLQYSFDYYHEPTSGGANDFRAHSIFAVLNFRLP